MLPNTGHYLGQFESHYKSLAELSENELVGNALEIGTFAAGVVEHKR